MKSFMDEINNLTQESEGLNNENKHFRRKINAKSAEIKKLSEKNTKLCDSSVEKDKKIRQLKENLDNRTKCTICFDEILNIAFIPCFHLASCQKCAHQILSTTSKCPICRRDVHNSTKIYIP